jgi:hypothetical protein
MIRRLLSVSLILSAAFGLSNCAAPGPPVATAESGTFGSPARAGSASYKAAPAPMVECAPPEDRRGLATGWGQRREDKVGTTIFERDSTRPVGVAKLFYNNSAGAMAMAGGDWSHSNSFRDYAGGIFRVGLRNHRGAALSAYQSGGNLICIGEDGQRYSVEVENLSNHRLEFVVTVDGLDVLTGQSGAYHRRGYVLDPGERREIKGWRTSMDEVATFKFGSVGDAYVTKKTGDARNVGVIGAAVFSERGTTPRPYAGTENYRRLRADPFVASPAGSGFATPPSR